MGKTILEMKNVTKRFPGVTALNDVSIDIKKGEILAICGENGAGKSTLMKILSGSYTHSEFDGEIYINGRQMQFKNIREAKSAGIEMVYQEQNMVLNGTIGENLFIGNLPGNFFVDRKKLYAETERILEQLGIDATPDMQAGFLNSGQIQMLSVMRSALRKPKVMVFDEPTSSLTDNETKILFDLIRKLRGEGVAIAFISHKLEEVFELADRIVVLRDGAVISIDPADAVTKEQLIERMVGRKVENLYPKVRAEIGEEILRVENLTVPHPTEKGKNIVENISFSLHRGEVLGLGGLVGAGRSEALAAVFGQTTDGVKKKVFIRGKQVPIHNPRDAKAAGIGFVTEERRTTGFIPAFSVCKNLTICIMNKLCKGLFIDKNKEREIAGAIFDRLKIKAPSLDTQIINLSGGNQQKVVLGKWLLAESDILFIDEPTKGIDVGAKAEIYSQISELAQRGIGIVMVSSDMPELVSMSDRCLVLSGGRITGEFTGSSITQENILAAAIMN